MHPSSTRGLLARTTRQGALEFEQSTADFIAHCGLALVVVHGGDGGGCCCCCVMGPPG